MNTAEAVLARLSEAAWAVRKNARLHGKTAVGCAVMDNNGRIYAGCNIEHAFRCHDVHAEVNALSTLVAQGGGLPTVVLIAAERDRFTPCGSCLDWIFELAGGVCKVVFSRRPGAVGVEDVDVYTAIELMPHYPA